MEHHTEQLVGHVETPWVAGESRDLVIFIRGRGLQYPFKSIKFIEFVSTSLSSYLSLCFSLPLNSSDLLNQNIKARLKRSDIRFRL